MNGLHNVRCSSFIPLKCSCFSTQSPDYIDTFFPFWHEFKNSVGPEIGLFLCNRSLTTFSTSSLLWNQQPSKCFSGSNTNMLHIITTTSVATYQQICPWLPQILLSREPNFSTSFLYILQVIQMNVESCRFVFHFSTIPKFLPSILSISLSQYVLLCAVCSYCWMWHQFCFNPLPSLTLQSAQDLNVPCRPKCSKALLF
jgi:hypothetical protein